MTATHVAGHTNPHALNATHEVDHTSPPKYHASSDSTCPHHNYSQVKQSHRYLQAQTVISSWENKAIEEAETRPSSSLTINNDIRDVNPEAE
ncbi:15127_t:CDS:2 [Acaulospora colombiana]|uniref:15127_t:CDS:1 n=1 Tax=Acaulospora colombiana TaxID=27376 RepID=A0ACA9LUL2_9GLOM|nr:15127_t:CDS:2 [Acaulospora colombiana]